MEKVMLDETALREKVEQCETLDEVYALLRDVGLEISEEELAQIVSDAQAGELSEDALDDVAGGRVLKISVPVIPIKAVSWWIKLHFPKRR